MRKPDIIAKVGLDIVGDKWSFSDKPGVPLYKYIVGFILNWIKLPFQLKLFQTPVVLLPEVKKLDMNNLVVKEDHTSAYYSNNTAMDGHSHDTDNQVVRHAMYLFLSTDLEDHVFKAALRFFVSNINGGQTLTNGVSWKDGTAHYHGDNVSTETLAMAALIMTDNPTFEKLVNNILDNGGYLNLLNDPGGKKSKKYQQLLKEAGFDRLNVPMENPATNVFPGFSKNDAAVVLLASLAVCTTQEAKKLFNIYNYVFGYGLKARFSSNTLEVITSLYILLKATKKEKYEKILRSKFNEDGKIEDLFKRYLYGQLILGVK